VQSSAYEFKGRYLKNMGQKGLGKISDVWKLLQGVCAVL
jgi:hypothetical protein